MWEGERGGKSEGRGREGSVWEGERGGTCCKWEGRGEGGECVGGRVRWYM